VAIAPGIWQTGETTTGMTWGSPVDIFVTMESRAAIPWE